MNILPADVAKEVRDDPDKVRSAIAKQRGYESVGLGERVLYHDGTQHLAAFVAYKYGDGLVSLTVLGPEGGTHAVTRALFDDDETPLPYTWSFFA